jgi:hypothetical protein
MLLEETNSPEIGICLSTPLRTRRSRKELYSSAKLGMFSESRPMRDRPIVCWRVKPVGEPCAGNPHARFDERECGNGAWHAAIEARTGKPRHGTMPKPTPPRHLSTLPGKGTTLPPISGLTRSKAISGKAGHVFRGAGIVPRNVDAGQSGTVNGCRPACWGTTLFHLPND